MKNIIKFILAIILMSGFVSCQEEQDLLILTPPATFQIETPLTGDGVALSAETPLNSGLVLVWKDAEYGTPTEVTYKIQVDKAGNNFAKPQEIVSTAKTFATIASGVLNAVALKVGLAPFAQGAIEVRIKATVGTTGSQETFSNVITYLIKTYTTDLPQLAVAKIGGDPKTAVKIAASAFGATDFTGYVWIDGNHKFIGPDAAGVYDWNKGPEYGLGSTAGTLKSPGGGDIIAEVGYYLINADTKKLTYSEKKTTWSIIGNGTPGGWGADTPMTYSASTKKWTVTAVLTTQAAPNDGMKFRANNDWGINFGDTGADFTLEQGGTNISTTAGTYLITLDLSNPRKYTYSLTKK